MAPVKRSNIWQYFSKQADSLCASCNMCKQSISFKSTTTNLKTHLKRKHVSCFVSLSGDVPNESINENIDDPLPAVIVNPQPSTSRLDRLDLSSETQPHELNPPRKKQKSMSTYVFKKKNITQAEKKQIDRDLLDLFIKDFQPFSIVEDEGFKKFARWIPGYELPGRKAISSIMIPSIYQKCLTSAKETMAKEAETVCITTDCWSSSKMESYIAITAHYINKQFEFKSVLLACTNFTDNHTSVNLASEIKKILSDWNLQNKVNFAVSDNASNITNVFESILKLKHFGCYAHTVNLIVNDALDPVQPTIGKIKKIVSYFKRSSLATEKLLKYQMNKKNEEEVNSQPKRLIQDVATRWNSTFYMLKRFLELEEALRATIALLDKDLPTLTAEDWQFCRELAEILSPFEEMTRRVSGEKYLTGSEVLVFTRTLLVTCEKLKKKGYTNAADVLDSLENGLRERFKNIEFSSTYGLCTLLNPLYKGHLFENSSALERIIKNLRGMVSAVIQEKSVKTTPPVKSSLPNTEDELEKVSAFSVMHELIYKNCTQGKQITPYARAIKEIDSYLADDSLEYDDTGGDKVLKWWKDNQYAYPNLSTVFRRKCNIVATSVPCERVFSKAGLLSGNRRTRLATQKVEMLMFLNANSELSKEKE